MKLEIVLAGDPSLPLPKLVKQLKFFAGLQGIKLPQAFFVQLWEENGDIHFEIADGTTIIEVPMCTGRIKIT